MSRPLSPWHYLPAALLPAFYARPGAEPRLGPPARRSGAWSRLPAHLVPVAGCEPHPLPPATDKP